MSGLNKSNRPIDLANSFVCLADGFQDFRLDDRLIGEGLNDVLGAEFDRRTIENFANGQFSMRAESRKAFRVDSAGDLKRASLAKETILHHVANRLRKNS